MLGSNFRLPISLLALVFVISSAGLVFAGQKISIPLSGTAVINEVTNMGVSPPLLNMEKVEVGKDSSKSVIITHLGEVGENDIVINGITLSGANSDEFFVEFPEQTVLSPGDSTQLEITFFPVTVGKKSAAIHVDHDGASAEHVIFLNGEGGEQAVSELKAAPVGVNLGTILMGDSSVKNLVLSNEGDTDGPLISIDSIEINGDNASDFSTNFNAMAILAPGESKTVKVTMNSTTYGDKSAELSVLHDGANPTLKVGLSGKVENPDTGDEEDPVFTQSELKGLSSLRPTTLQFGPDGKLYLGQMNGLIQVLTIQRTGANNYKVTNSQTIDLVNKMVNHDDDGSVNGSIKGRLLTGMIVVGTAQDPQIYLVSGDPRQGAGPSGVDKNLDTNSGILSRLYKQGTSWAKEDLLRGLPRSEENHQGNGLVFDKSGTKILLANGGNTNTGAPSHNFALLPEVALSGAILEIDLNKLGNTPYDLPTLNDEDRSGANDYNDPFGGNNGKNQAILEANGPVQIYAPGFRNAYDLVLTESNRLYTVDNGGNANWGGEPVGNCTNKVDNGGQTYRDGLHYISHRGYYGGHPNPTRGKKSNTFNSSNPQSPIAQVSANPVECNFQAPGINDMALDIFMKSTNGLDEYTASNFSGAMKGDLITASFDKAVWRIELNKDGDVLMSKSKLFPEAGIVPLDVIAQGDNEIFPGTIWVTDFNSNTVNVFEPQDY